MLINDLLTNKPQELLVVYNDLIVGRLNNSIQTPLLTFTYEKSWVKNNYFPISLSIPLRLEPYTHDLTCTAFFNNLRPEGDSLVDICFFNKMSKNNIFSFLKHYGRDCSGAFTIIDPLTHKIETNFDYIDVTNKIISELSKPFSKQSNLIIATGAKLSLAGAQNKLPVLFKDNLFFIPAQNSTAPTSHIIKVSNQRFKNLVRNESFCLDLARAIGLPVCNSQLLHINNIDMLVIQRYDRVIDKITNNFIRLHQEDFCQALGVDKTAKYQSDGGLGLNNCINLLNYIDNNQLNSYKNLFIKAFIYNFIIGNCDAHAKNFSLLYDNNSLTNYELKLAPFYDLVSTVVYPGLDQNLSMSIGSSYARGNISKKNFLDFLNVLEINSDVFLALYLDITDSIKKVLDELIALYIDKTNDSFLFSSLKKEIYKGISLLSKVTQI
jgi:serine/threonine-protein kinase HipA